MLPLSLVLVLTSALAADLSPEELIGRLGSPDRVVREEAARTLEERGVGSPAGPPRRARRGRRAGGPRTVRRPDRPGRGPLARSADDGRARRRRPTARRGRRGARHPQRLLAVTRRPGPRRPTSHRAGLGPAAVLGSASTGSAAPGTSVTTPGRAATTSAPIPGRRRSAWSPGTLRLTPRIPGPLRIHLFATHRHRDVNFEADGVSRVPRQDAPR